MIGSRTGQATSAQAIRFAELHDIGCIACRLRGVGWVPPEMDHRNVGDLAGMPRTEGGHDDTLPLCCWHHRGISHQGYGKAESLKIFGPSKQLHKKLFIETFGTIDELYQQLNAMLDRYRAATRIRPAC